FRRFGPLQKQLVDCRSCETRGQQAGLRADFVANKSFIFLRRIERVTAPQQFMHHRGPERRGGPDGKRVTHWPAVEISDPNCDGMFFIETDRPGVAKSAARSSFRGDSFVERER